MADATYTENPAGIAAMLRSPWMAAAMEARGRRGMEYGEVLSPVRTGRYVGLIDVPPGGWHIRTVIVDGHVRAIYWNPTPYSIFLEKGTQYMAAQHVVLRSIDGMRD